MKLLIVESPAKAKTIEKYLGKDYKVIASYGHVRDLVSKDGSVDPDNDFSMKWEIDATGAKQIKAIKEYVKKADEVFLATDPDREGEAISWHIADILKNELKTIPVKRVVFHEITKNAVKSAIDSPRDLNNELVNAYLARRALDYLVGFKLSPILWRKLPKSKSAGRVQSVALRLIFEREVEIENFKVQEYWSLVGCFSANEGNIYAKLITYNGEKLDKLAIQDEKSAEDILNRLKALNYHVKEVEKKVVSRKPFAPFITSTLQQEASRKLGFSARQTMSCAQKLYEGMSINGEQTGLITYMRTDSVNLSLEAVDGIRKYISETYSSKYLPSKPNVFVNKVKNAQEAHEAIRPVNFALTPEKLKGIISDDLLRLYDLIWKRTIACQMQNAKLNQVSIDISDNDSKNIFRATGSTIIFDGFLKVYDESKDDGAKEDALSEEQKLDKQLLPDITNNENVSLLDIDKNQHFTKPPFRYTEASLVKKLEELGIGRPSTYANILYVLQQRGYVSLKQRKFFIENLGRFVTSFLISFFSRYVEFDFTAKLEQKLDDISNGALDWKDVLKEFWNEFSVNIADAEKLRITDVINHLEQDLDKYLFSDKNGVINKVCPKCNGVLSLKLGKFGAFIACKNYPDCDYTKRITLGDTNTDNMENDKDTDSGQITEKAFDPKELGVYNDEKVYLKKGPYGFYVQLGDGKKPKRHAIPKTLNVEEIDFDKAVFLLSLPKELGKYEEKEISVAIGRFGPYIKYGDKFFSVKNINEFMTMSLEKALEIIKNPVEKKSKGKVSKEKR